MKHTYKTDGGGYATKCDDIKLFDSISTWNTKLSQIAKTNGHLYIMTHSLNYFYYPDGHTYLDEIIGKRPFNISIIVNSDNLNKAKTLQQKYPLIKIKHHPKMNAKIALLAPHTVMYSSSDFGTTYRDNFVTGKFESDINLGVGFHSEEIFNHMLQTFKSYWEQSEYLVC